MTVPPGAYTSSPQLTEQSTFRRQISRYSAKTLGLRIQSTAGPADPDSISVVVHLNTTFDDTPGNAIITGSYQDSFSTITRNDVGEYVVDLSPQYTAVPGLITVNWTYSVAGTTFVYADYYSIQDAMPLYDSLSESQQDIITMVTWTMSDLFDSTVGGPWLIEQFQTAYNYERLAQLLTVTVQKINTMFQPLTNYTAGITPGPSFPETYNSVLFQGLYVETIRHFIRSYTEIPDIKGSPGVAYTDRRDYASRWKAVLDDELDDYKFAVRQFKRKLLNLGSGSYIVAGGIFGSSGNRFMSGMYSSQVRGRHFAMSSFVLPVGGGSGAGARWV